jgi:septum formation protein
MSPRLILASTSKIRQHLLRQAGLEFEVITAAVDEAAWKQHHTTASPQEIAMGLAREKSVAVSRHHPEALVIGADQTLGLERFKFDKPASMAEAQAQLTMLRGKTHALYSAVSCCRQGKEVFAHCSSARMTMRNFSDAFLETYLRSSGQNLLSSVGGYKLEEQGIQLFEQIEGDYFTILGLPLLPLLAFLRTEGLVSS